MKVEKQRSVTEASSRTKQPRSGDVAVKEMASQSPGNVDTNTEHPEVVDSVAWPSRDDEYGIPVVNEGNKDNVDWVSEYPHIILTDVVSVSPLAGGAPTGRTYTYRQEVHLMTFC